jgi:RimJ/RimL family protein N-acetyltransferase
MQPARIRPWEPGDLDRLARGAGALSATTRYRRFWAGVPGLPYGYLASIERRWPTEWDAVVAVEGEQLLGWAEFARDGRPGSADIAFCVVDDWQRRGLGTALLAALLARCAAAGVGCLHADIQGDNVAARALWAAAAGGAGWRAGTRYTLVLRAPDRASAA